MANNDKSLKLYRNTAPNGELHKDKWLEDELTLPVITVKDDTSITDPHFIIKTFDGLIEYNYLYYDDFKRYYYINDMILRTGGQVELICHVDVLYSFRNAIGELVVQEERATNGSSKFIYDDQVTTMVNKKISEVLEMNFDEGQGFGFDSEILATCIAPTNYTSRNANNDTPNPTPTITDIDTPVKYAEYMLAYKKLEVMIRETNKMFGDKTPKSYTGHYSQASSLSDCDGSSRKPYGFTRYDTMFPEEKIQVPNLNLIDDTYIATHSSQIPAPYNQAGYRWSSWDCAQFVWRCWFFGGGIDIASDTPGNGYSSYSTTQMIYLLNHGCYIPYTDLKPGDVIFSGYEDAIDDWDSNDDNVHIACRSDAHPQWILKSDANAPSSSEAGYVEFRTTHVRMVYSSTSAIESLGNAIYSTLSDVGVPTGGSIDVREIPQNPVQYNPYINNTPYGDTYDTNSKLYQRLFMCCRPSLLREDNE